jgi:hypothetical protein
LQEARQGQPVASILIVRANSRVHCSLYPWSSMYKNVNCPSKNNHVPATGRRLHAYGSNIPPVSSGLPLAHPTGQGRRTDISHLGKLRRRPECCYSPPSVATEWRAQVRTSREQITPKVEPPEMKFGVIPNRASPSRQARTSASP